MVDDASVVDAASARLIDSPSAEDRVINHHSHAIRCANDGLVNVAADKTAVTEAVLAVSTYENAYQAVGFAEEALA
ncbi:hypothetical protein [Mycobacterium sp. NAZ190054]|uniref:hypothetical protein n=1 Tax=Mycobacterium sp. NAZ190054 TaxID=1747766 RepID=UPI0012E3ACAD|nr:hypothetical protein [Mycobacterium sp. NAZ190054]